MDSFVKSLVLIMDVPRWFMGIMCGSGFLAYYYIKVVQPPTVSCLPGQYKKFLECNVPIVKEKFWPTIWCFESRMQTVMASFLRKTLDVKYEREIVTLKDGGRLALDWMVNEPLPPETPVILILPGLTGSSKTMYVRGLITCGQEAGYRCVVLNYRGIGGLPLTTPVTYCASKTHDVEEVVRIIKSRYPNAPLGATGISMGGLMLGNYLASQEEKQNRHVCAAMLISVPFDIFRAVESMEKPVLNILINRHLVNCITGVIERSRDILDGTDKPWDLNEVYSCKTIREFDTKFTTKVFGYNSIEEYYTDATLTEKFSEIRTPLLCLNSADDPFQPLYGDPEDIFSRLRNNNVAFVCTARGGHIAFMEGIWPVKGHREYMGRFFAQYFTAMFKDDTYKQFLAD